MMHLIPIHITEQQKVKLFKRKEKTKLTVAAQIREAIDNYLETFTGDEYK